MGKSAKHIAALPLFLWLVLFSINAHAAIDNSGVLDNVLARYQSASTTWAGVITARATWLFWVLVTISMVWTFGLMALRKADIGEFFSEFIRFTVFTGFFWWLLTNGPTMATNIMDGLRTVAGNASGVGPNLTPSGVVDIGFDIFFKVLDQSSFWTPVDSAAGILISAVILVVLGLVGVNMLILLVSGWILAYAGVFFLGFGGSKWTSEMAIGYFKTVLGLAAQLFTMVLLVGIGKSFVDQYYAGMSAGMSLKELGVMMIVAVILLMLVNKVPPLVGGLAGGATGALGSGFGAGAAVGAAAMGAAAVATAGAAIAAGGASMAGGAQALMAAFSKANASQSAGGGSGGAGSGMMGDALNAAGAGEGVGASSGLAMAMGDGGVASSNVNPSTLGSSSGTAGDGGGASSTAAEGSPGGATGQGAGANTTSEPVGAGDGAESNSASSETAGTGSATAGSGQSTPNQADAGQGETKSTSARVAAAAGAAAAKVSRVAAGTAGNLAQGSWDVAKAKAGSVRDKAMERISQTTGGKIAAAITARADAEAAKAAGAGPAAFDGNSLSGSDPGERTADAAAEIAAFRDRKSS